MITPPSWGGVSNVFLRLWQQAREYEVRTLSEDTTSLVIGLDGREDFTREEENRPVAETVAPVECSKRSVLLISFVTLGVRGSHQRYISHVWCKRVRTKEQIRDPSCVTEVDSDVSEFDSDNLWWVSQTRSARFLLFRLNDIQGGASYFPPFQSAIRS